MVFGADARRQRRRFIGGDAEPVHAGVDMQRSAAAPVIGGAEGVPFGELDQAADHRPRAQFGEGRRGAGHQAVEHVDRRLRRHGAGGGGFRQVGDEEGLAAGTRELAGDRLDAAAIAVGLDDGGAFGGRGAARQRAPIGFERAEIDGENAARMRRRRAGGEGRLRRRRLGRALLLLGCGLDVGHGG